MGRGLRKPGKAASVLPGSPSGHLLARPHGVWAWALHGGHPGTPQASCWAAWQAGVSWERFLRPDSQPWDWHLPEACCSPRGAPAPWSSFPQQVCSPGWLLPEGRPGCPVRGGSGTSAWFLGPKEWAARGACPWLCPVQTPARAAAFLPQRARSPGPPRAPRPELVQGELAGTAAPTRPGRWVSWVLGLTCLTSQLPAHRLAPGYFIVFARARFQSDSGHL